MNLRSGQVTQYQPIRSKGFNVKLRAAQPASTNIVITSDQRKRALAASYGIAASQPQGGEPADLVHAHHYETSLNAQEVGKRYLLIGYGSDYLYYGLAPLTMRDPRANPAAASPDPKFAMPPDTDQIKLTVQYDGPVTIGGDKPSRDGLMGASALNYAASLYGREFAEAKRWEWLHIVGRSLGGNHEVGNLVAGSFDANTQMIPYEKRIQELSQNATPDSPLTVNYEVNLYPNSWIAMDISMDYDGCGEVGESRSFPAQSSLPFDKLQYDLWLKTF